MVCIKKLLLFAALLMVCSVGVSASLDDVSFTVRYFNFGTAITGSQTVNASLYDSLTGGSIVASVEDTYVFVNGYTTITFENASTLDWSEDYYLDVVIGGNSFTPRTPVTSQPALKIDYDDLSDGSLLVYNETANKWTVLANDTIGDRYLAYNTGQHLTTTSNVVFNALNLTSTSYYNSSELCTAKNGLCNTTAATYSHLSNFTDDLGARGYTHLSNFTDDIGVSADWDEVGDVPSAAPSNGDTTHLSTADQIFDWVTGLGYSTTTGTVTSVATDDYYLTGGAITAAGTISFNETLLNATIDARDSDTTYTADGYYLFLTATQFNFNETLLNATIAALDTDTWNTTEQMIAAVNGSGITITGGAATATSWDGETSQADLNVNHSDTATTWDGETSQANLNVNSSAYWDALNSPADINAGDITDDGTYLTSYSETDPLWVGNSSLVVYFTNTTAWDKDSSNDLLNGSNANFNVLKAVDWTNVSVTESQISDLQSYLTSYTETDPLWAANISLVGFLAENEAISGTWTMNSSTICTAKNGLCNQTDITGNAATATSWDGETSQANLNVNSSNYWDAYDTPSAINVGDFNNDGTYLTAETDPLWVANISLFTPTSGLVAALGNWTADKSSYWNTSADLDTVISDDEIAEAKIAFGTVCAAGNHLYVSGNDLACEADDDTTFSAGNGISLATTTFSVAAGTGLSQDAGGLSVTADGINDTHLAYNTGQHLTTTSNPTFNNATITDCVVFASGGQICSGG